MSDCRDYGCVVNFPPGEKQFTIWRYGDRFELRPFGPGEVHPWSHDPLFQKLAAEVYRLASEVGRLRRLEIEVAREEARRGLAE